MLTREQNIFLSKKTFVELVYNTAYIEGCNVTFPQTQTIIDGAVVNGIAVDDIQTVLNLRDAWKYCIENVDAELNLDYIWLSLAVANLSGCKVIASFLYALRISSSVAVLVTPNISYKSFAIYSFLHDFCHRLKARGKSVIFYLDISCRL